MASKNSHGRASFGGPIETLKVGSAGTHNMLEVARRHQARFLLRNLLLQAIFVM
jgi:GDP-D-mannose dehydratase